MLPTPDRIRAARRSAGLAAGAVALGLAAAAWVLVPPPPRWWVIAAVVAVAMLWPWLALRRWRRRGRVAAAGLAAEDRELLAERVAFYRELDTEGRERFERMAAVFLDEVAVHGIGCEATRSDRLLVAASALIPVFGFPAWEYDGLAQVLLRPEHFDATFSEGREEALEALGMVADGGLFSGTVVLSLPALREGFEHAHDGHNVGIHEFAHLVDGGSGSIDGLPPGMSPQLAGPWVELVRSSFAQREHERLLRAYGYSNHVEFFAVSSELFFENPDKLRRAKPELYDLLVKIYRQRPARRRKRARLRAAP